jgi:hypothetical protein
MVVPKKSQPVWMVVKGASGSEGGRFVPFELLPDSQTDPLVVVKKM